MNQSDQRGTIVSPLNIMSKNFGTKASCLFHRQSEAFLTTTRFRPFLTTRLFHWYRSSTTDSPFRRANRWTRTTQKSMMARLGLDKLNHGESYRVQSPYTGVWNLKPFRSSKLGRFIFSASPLILSYWQTRWAEYNWGHKFILPEVAVIYLLGGCHSPSK